MLIIFIPTSLIQNQSKLHAKPNESDSQCDTLGSVTPLFTLLFVWVRTGFLLSSTVLLSLGGKQKIRRTASWNHVLSVWWEKVLVQGRAHRDASLCSSFPRCHRQMQKKTKKKNRWQYYSSAAFHWWEMQIWADHCGLMILIWLLQSILVKKRDVLSLESNFNNQLQVRMEYSNKSLP